MAKRALGLKSFKIGPIAADGGMGTALVEILDGVIGGATISMDDNTIKDFKTLQGGLVESVVTEYGSLNYQYQSYDLDPDKAILVFGGTVATSGTGAAAKKSFTPPDKQVTLYKSIEYTTNNDVVFKIARASVNAKFDWDFNGEELAIITINGKALQPDKAGEPIYTYSVPNPA